MGITHGGATVVLVERSGEAMHVQTYPDRAALVKDMLETIGVARGVDPIAHIAWLETLPSLIQETIDRIKEDWSLP